MTYDRGLNYLFWVMFVGMCFAISVVVFTIQAFDDCRLPCASPVELTTQDKALHAEIRQNAIETSDALGKLQTELDAAIRRIETLEQASGIIPAKPTNRRYRTNPESSTP